MITSDVRCFRLVIWLSVSLSNGYTGIVLYPTAFDPMFARSESPKCLCLSFVVPCKIYVGTRFSGWRNKKQAFFINGFHHPTIFTRAYSKKGSSSSVIKGSVGDVSDCYTRCDCMIFDRCCNSGWRREANIPIARIHGWNPVYREHVGVAVSLALGV